MKNTKQVKKINPNKLKKNNFNFYLFSYIKENHKLPEVSLSKYALSYHLKFLKRANLIKYVGYSVWETVGNFDFEKIKQAKQVKKNQPNTPRHQPTIRGHAFEFKLSIPKIENWCKRRDFFNKNNIKYKELNIRGKGERIYFKGRKIWITDKSIIVFEKNSYIADSAKESKNYAIYELIELIKALERLFLVSFKINKSYKFKVSKQHYARLSCELARQYRKDNKKLYVKQEDGTIWFWTDYALNIDESETGNTIRSDKDMDEHIHPFLNGLRNIKGYTPEFVVNSLAEIIKDKKYYAENLRSHVKAIQTLGEYVKRLGDLISSPLIILKQNINSLKDIPLYKNEILSLNKEDKERFSLWLFDRFGIR